MLNVFIIPRQTNNVYLSSARYNLIGFKTGVGFPQNRKYGYTTRIQRQVGDNSLGKLRNLRLLLKRNIIALRADGSKVVGSLYSTPKPPGRLFLVPDHVVVRALYTFVCYHIFNKISTVVVLFVQQCLG